MTTSRDTKSPNGSVDPRAWPEPLSMLRELPAVQPFHEILLPASFRPLVRDIAERMQVPMDFPAVATLSALAGTVNRRATIQPKVRDSGWIVVPNLWGAIIGYAATSRDAKQSLCGNGSNRTNSVPIRISSAR